MHNLQAEYYRGELFSMRMARTRGRKNIAKPVLMLAIIENIEKGLIVANHIVITLELKEEYKRQFALYSDNKETPIEYPFYYLKGESFYFIKGDTTKVTPSAKFLRESVEYAYLDEQLWDLLQEAEVREEFKRAIIGFYLKKD